MFDFENIIHGEKEQLKKLISDCGEDQNKLFGIVNDDDSLTLAILFNEFFITKIDNIRHEFPILQQNLPMPSSIHFYVILDLNLVSSLTYFKHTDVDEVNVLLSKMNKTICMFHPFPTRFLLNFSHLFIDVIVRIINLTASFPAALNQLLSSHFKKLHLAAIF